MQILYIQPYREFKRGRISGTSIVYACFSRNANRNLTYYISAEESVLKGLFTDFRKGVNINKVAGREIHNNNTLANCTRAPSSRGSDNCMPAAGWAT